MSDFESLKDKVNLNKLHGKYNCESIKTSAHSIVNEYKCTYATAIELIKYARS